MTPYGCLIDREALDQLHRLRRRERRDALDFIDRLTREPFLLGEATTTDSLGRTNQISVFGRLLITHWSDHAECNVRILRLEQS